MRRLSFQVHVALVATLVVSAVLASIARVWLEPGDPAGFSWEHLMLHWLLPVALLATLLGLAAYPVARRLTRRLERLQAQVEALGRGDLGARVEAEGNDEVAELARSFNRTAERIEQLIDAQRRLLAGVSHELRSPLARVRVAAELLVREGRPEQRDQIERDIAELDDLISELLLASRLEVLEPSQPTETAPLLDLLAEEAACAGADRVSVQGESIVVRGDPRMLRRLIRNLLDNAVRHGGGGPIDASVEPLPPSMARLCVADRGPGVPVAERERIFEPFYQPSGPTRTDGVGLGLALVRQIARHHGGDARCVARAGGGSRFEVDLPLAR
jgi:signal transduction histidine kinase